MENTGDTGSTSGTESASQDTAIDSGVDTSVDSGNDGGMDINAAVDSIGSDLFGKHDRQDNGEPADDPVDAATDDPADPVDTEDAAPDPEAIAPPQSWAKETHEIWKQIPKAAQEQFLKREKQMLDGLQGYKDAADFGRPLKDVITPFMPMIQARGIDAPKAVAALLNAQHRLDTNPVQGLIEIAKSYNIDLTKLAEGAAQTQQVDPAVKQLQDELNGIKTHLSAGQQRAMQEAQTKVAAEVNAFASDPAHSYFDELADDIVAMLKAGEPLDKAYEKAVWANPVTRAKELARVNKENAAKLRKESQEKADAARKASSTNVRSRDTRRAPTEPVGTMEDTMKAELARIKSAVH